MLLSKFWQNFAGGATTVLTLVDGLTFAKWDSSVAAGSSENGILWKWEESSDLATDNS